MKALFKVGSLLGLAVALAGCWLPSQQRGESSVVPPPPPPLQQGAQAAPPVPATKPTSVDSRLVEVGKSGRYCPAFVASQSTKSWKKVGSNPFKGSLEHALERFKGVPEPVKAGWLAEFKAGRQAQGRLKVGDIICSMMYSRSTPEKSIHHRWDKVSPAEGWTDAATGAKIAPEGLVVYTHAVEADGFRWILSIPPKALGGCENWNWYAEKLPAPA